MQKLKNIVHRTIKTGQKETGNDLSMVKLYKNYKKQVKMNKRLRWWYLCKMRYLQNKELCILHKNGINTLGFMSIEL